MRLMKYTTLSHNSMNSPKRACIVEEESEGDADSQFSGSDEEADEFLDFITTADGQSCAGESMGPPPPCALGFYFHPYYEKGTELTRKGGAIDEHVLSLSSTEHKLECKLDSASSVTAGKFGRLLHVMVQVECGGRGTDMSGDMRAYESTMRKVGVLLRAWMDENRLVLDTNLTEKLLMSESSKVRGKVDLVFRTHEGVLVVGEIKTTRNKISHADHIRSSGQIKVYTLVQMSEYVELLREKSAKVSSTGVLVSLKFYEELVKLEVVAVDLTERTAMGEHELVPMELAYWLRDVASTVPRPRFDRTLENLLRQEKEQLVKTLGLYTCGDCGKVFARKAHLGTHIMSVHLRLKPFECNTCKKMFSSSSQLMTHMNGIHLMMKPFPCNICKKTFAQRAGSALRRHVKEVHLKERLFKCDTCGLCISRNVNLVKHKKTHQ